MSMVGDFLVIDFEATCSNDESISPREMEIIEIGAVIVGAESFEVRDDFCAFVRPATKPETVTLSMSSAITAIDICKSEIE